MLHCASVLSPDVLLVGPVRYVVDRLRRADQDAAGVLRAFPLLVATTLPFAFGAVGAASAVPHTRSLVLGGSDETRPAHFSNLRVCRYPAFSLAQKRCTRDQRATTLVSSKFACSVTFRVRQSKRLHARLTYEGKSVHEYTTRVLGRACGSHGSPRTSARHRFPAAAGSATSHLVPRKLARASEVADQRARSSEQRSATPGIPSCTPIAGYESAGATKARGRFGQPLASSAAPSMSGK